MADAVLAWFARHPGFRAARAVFVELLGAAMVPAGSNARVTKELSDVQNLLAARMEQWFKDQERHRVLVADIPTIEDWCLRVLDAASLQDVFA